MLASTVCVLSSTQVSPWLSLMLASTVCVLSSTQVSPCMAVLSLMLASTVCVRVLCRVILYCTVCVCVLCRVILRILHVSVGIVRSFLRTAILSSLPHLRLYTSTLGTVKRTGCSSVPSRYP